jgi:hypothetical protein
MKKENCSLAQKVQRTEISTSFNDAFNCEICVALAEVEIKTSAEYWRNDTNRGKLKYSAKKNHPMPFFPQ